MKQAKVPYGYDSSFERDMSKKLRVKAPGTYISGSHQTECLANCPLCEECQGHRLCVYTQNDIPLLLVNV